MTDGLLNQKSAGSVPIWMLAPLDLVNPPENFPQQFSHWVKATDFQANPEEISIIASAEGAIAGVLFGIGDYSGDKNSIVTTARNAMAVGKMAKSLPPGNYHLEGQVSDPDHAALGWLMGGYRFNRYLSDHNKVAKKTAKLTAPSGTNIANVERSWAAIRLVRDLINTPANDLGPDNLEKEFRNLANHHSADVHVTSGDALLTENFPMIHAVGRASVEAPRLLEMNWGKMSDPKLTLVGKGVSFDTGGLNIKPGSSMALMKKDMGGAANVMGLASMVMAAKLPVCLRVIVPAVENSISGNAFRPGDILPSRKGLSVEIGNTDAEGRLILADALSYADEQAPDILIDMATLTGAARVALGPDLPPFYTHDGQFAEALSVAGMKLNDPLWRMPLWAPYTKMLSSKIADINHISTGGFAGSITAALFLNHFVEKAAIWTHVDLFAWVPNEKPWAPAGGEAQTIRALFDVISTRFPA